MMNNTTTTTNNNKEKKKKKSPRFSRIILLCTHCCIILPKLIGTFILAIIIKMGEKDPTTIKINRATMELRMSQDGLKTVILLLFYCLLLLKK